MQCELELVREEKRRIESQVKALQQERELHSQKVRQEAEQLAKVNTCRQLSGTTDSSYRHIQQQYGIIDSSSTSSHRQQSGTHLQL